MTDSASPTEAHIRLNPNRVVAYNLKRARLLRGLTQEQAAEALKSYLGAHWAKQTFSMAEKAATRPYRVRRFDAAEIAAFAQVFNLPAAWFLMPPRMVVRVDGEPQLEIPRNQPDEPGVEVVDLVDSIIRTDSELDERLVYALDSEQGYRGLADELERRKGDAERRQVDRERALSLRTPARARS